MPALAQPQLLPPPLGLRDRSLAAPAGAPAAWSAPCAGLAAPHLRQLSFLPNTRSPQAGHCQSPGFAKWGPHPPHPAPGPETGPFGFGVLHLRQMLFLAKTCSPHVGQLQSPGRISRVVGWPFTIRQPPLPSGRAAPHRRHLVFLANWWSPQAGHSQSPGGSPGVCWTPCAGKPCCAIPGWTSCCGAICWAAGCWPAIITC
mmetsp:Transcript_33380/g.93797  ORF Transcript_33380/g.93797 Transcript_33380/m.93797 type:complete len:201 (+) Transcript_33380:2-604(+)